jgi:hypothetical protein
MVRVAVRVCAPAVTVTGVDAVTELVPIANVVLVAAAAAEPLAGIVAAVELVESVSTIHWTARRAWEKR